MRGSVLRILLVAEVLLGFTSGAYAAELPICADGQTIVYKDGAPTCGNVCSAYVYGSFGVAAYNIPAGNVGDIHPPEDEVGLPSGEARNTRTCTFHVQCTPTGWIATTTAADICGIPIWDVP
jgi:hypothetical protein